MQTQGLKIVGQGQMQQLPHQNRGSNVYIQVLLHVHPCPTISISGRRYSQTLTKESEVICRGENIESASMLTLLNLPSLCNHGKMSTNSFIVSQVSNTLCDQFMFWSRKLWSRVCMSMCNYTECSQACQPITYVSTVESVIQMCAHNMRGLNH